MNPRYFLALASPAALLLGSRLACAAPERHPRDAADLERMRYESAPASAAFEDGEQRFLAGDFEGARARFAEASRLTPKSALAARAHCQALSELGRREEAVAACRQGMTLRGSLLDRRALVGALMSGAPTPRDFYEASAHVSRLRNALGDAADSLGAECDLARGIGDEGMFTKCSRTLVQKAPDHYESLRAQSFLKSGSSGFSILPWIARGVFGALFLGTLAHALNGFRRRSQVVLSAGALASLLVTGAAHAEPATAGSERWQLSKQPIDGRDPEQSVMPPEQRDKNPLEFGYQLQDFTAEALKAERLGKPEVALKYWRAIAKAVPDKNTGFLRACAIYSKLKDREHGLEYCSTGLTLPPDATLADYQNYTTLLFAKEGPLSPEDSARAEALSRHLRSKDKRPIILQGERVECELAIAKDDLARLEKCSQALARYAPLDLKVISYQFAAAIRNGDLDRARVLIERARSNRLDAGFVARMEKTAAEASVWWRQLFRARSILIGAVGLVLAGGLIALTRRFARRRVLTQPTPAAVEP